MYKIGNLDLTTMSLDCERPIKTTHDFVELTDWPQSFRLLSAFSWTEFDGSSNAWPWQKMLDNKPEFNRSQMITFNRSKILGNAKVNWSWIGESIEATSFRKIPERRVSKVEFRTNCISTMVSGSYDRCLVERCVETCIWPIFPVEFTRLRNSRNISALIGSGAGVVPLMGCTESVDGTCSAENECLALDKLGQRWAAMAFCVLAKQWISCPGCTMSWR